MSDYSQVLRGSPSQSGQKAELLSSAWHSESPRCVCPPSPWLHELCPSHPELPQPKLHSSPSRPLFEPHFLGESSPSSSSSGGSPFSLSQLPNFSIDTLTVKYYNSSHLHCTFSGPGMALSTWLISSLDLHSSPMREPLYASHFLDEDRDLPG